MLAISAQTGHDSDIAWFEVGRGDPVVLIHGLGDDHRGWRRVVGELMMSHRVLLYDFRGQGGSSLGAANGTLNQLAADLVVLLDHLGVTRATLAGFSLGGTIAMRAAIDAPQRVSALALIATSSRVNAAAATWYADRADLVDQNSPLSREVLDQDTRDVYRQCPSEVATGLLMRRQATADPRGYANACRAMASLHDAPLDAELGAIAVPAMIVSGEQDQHCPTRAGQIIAERIAGSVLRVLPDSGHPIPVERPDDVVAAIRSVSPCGE